MFYCALYWASNLENYTRKKYIQSFSRACLSPQDSKDSTNPPPLPRQLNGINTQGENIADNGGIKEAYYAYLQWAKDNGEERPLPGLPFSTRQLFWLSAANVWCGKYRPESLKLRILTGAHSPAEFRVNGPFSNLPEFAKDWSCPADSKMNPAKRCAVW